ncbi:hypothetical protein CONPUDRAFT_165149 [Coniophora puteana RWD-64-598 SS2]|uniref:Uncharacterized protein n=1 Tax=Coniophora puteana (strain RWD-64-598) TaxID=741705 RepID=A0A5M3MQB4_CONPW|nr:uncharacterized protein CONPUDRAFT_165149 [Coniophora puteana RWD-64-598 SS2]EIW80904.1 hypothetical protein CONPUDRAFT_165149 [Coniophora puteana RWD-64-598 SS2]
MDATSSSVFIATTLPTSLLTHSNYPTTLISMSTPNQDVHHDPAQALSSFFAEILGLRAGVKNMKLDVQNDVDDFRSRLDWGLERFCAQEGHIEVLTTRLSEQAAIQEAMECQLAMLVGSVDDHRRSDRAFTKALEVFMTKEFRRVSKLEEGRKAFSDKVTLIQDQIDTLGRTTGAKQDAILALLSRLRPNELNAEVANSVTIHAKAAHSAFSRQLSSVRRELTNVKTEVGNAAPVPKADGTALGPLDETAAECRARILANVQKRIEIKIAAGHNAPSNLRGISDFVNGFNGCPEPSALATFQTGSNAGTSASVPASLSSTSAPAPVAVASLPAPVATAPSPVAVAPKSSSGSSRSTAPTSVVSISAPSSSCVYVAPLPAPSSSPLPVVSAPDAQLSPKAAASVPAAPSSHKISASVRFAPFSPRVTSTPRSTSGSSLLRRATAIVPPPSLIAPVIAPAADSSVPALKKSPLRVIPTNDEEPLEYLDYSLIKDATMGTYRSIPSPAVAISQDDVFVVKPVPRPVGSWLTCEERKQKLEALFRGEKVEKKSEAIIGSLVAKKGEAKQLPAPAPVTPTPEDISSDDAADIDVPPTPTPVRGPRVPLTRASAKAGSACGSGLIKRDTKMENPSSKLRQSFVPTSTLVSSKTSFKPLKPLVLPRPASSGIPVPPRVAALRKSSAPKVTTKPGVPCAPSSSSASSSSRSSGTFSRSSSSSAATSATSSGIPYSATSRTKTSSKLPSVTTLVTRPKSIPSRTASRPRLP